MLEKLNVRFEGECLGVNDTIDKCEYSITAKETLEGVQVIVDCDSWIGVHCVFNEIYEDFTLEQLLNDLHEQNLEHVENEVADLFNID